MKTTRRIVIMKGVAVAAVVAAAAHVNATEVEAQGWAVERAESFEAEARSLADQRGEWKKAAWLYRGAAQLRPAGDPEAVINLQMAGRLAFYTGNVEQAFEDLEEAGRRAMQGGDLLTAGQILTDAAWVAQKIGNSRDARRLAYRAQSIVSHPVLSDRVRAAVLERIIDGEGAAVAIADELPASLEFAPGLD